MNGRFSVFRRPVDHILIDGVFGPELNRRILEHAVSLREHFAPAVIGAAREIDGSFRQNLVCGLDPLFHDPACRDFEEHRKSRAGRSPLLGAIDALLLSPELRDILDTAPWPLCKFREINRWESQLSRYGDEGDKYNWHLDRLGDDTRIITVVYHFFAEPKRFRGGELELTDALAYGGRLLSNGDVVRLEPVNDRAILFPARTIHRVLPTRAPDDFGAGRFSVNVFAGRDRTPPAGRWY